MSIPPQAIDQLLQGFGVAPPFQTPPQQPADVRPKALPRITPSPVGPPDAAAGPPDVHDLRVQAGDPHSDPAQWGKREDGTLKGRGYLGLLKRPDGGVSSELSMSSEIDGREVLYPLLVPTLTRDEVEWLLNHPADPQSIPPTIQQKALMHAKARIAAGKSPFALTAEEPPL